MAKTVAPKVKSSILKREVNELAVNDTKAIAPPEVEKAFTINEFLRWCTPLKSDLLLDLRVDPQKLLVNKRDEVLIGGLIRGRNGQLAGPIHGNLQGTPSRAAMNVEVQTINLDAARRGYRYGRHTEPQQ